jgi:hypothetical protein
MTSGVELVHRVVEHHAEGGFDLCRLPSDEEPVGVLQRLDVPPAVQGAIP